ncbi:hypothetical protein BDZ45DRAFT_253744 [Acephala macrosclerotiorum]|nr:hypothetical protein BDZ45DRAFT_253744 [Acephala macrosclerotiorum]
MESTMTADASTNDVDPRHGELNASVKMTATKMVEVSKIETQLTPLQIAGLHPGGPSPSVEHDSEKLSPQCDTLSTESIEIDEDEWEFIDKLSDNESILTPEPSDASPTQTEDSTADVEDDRIISGSHLMVGHKTLPFDNCNVSFSPLDLQGLQIADSLATKLSIAALLGRHEHCACGVTVSDTGEIDPPLHEIAMGAPYINKIFQRACNGNYILLDKQHGLWHLIRPEKPAVNLLNLKVIASGAFNPYLTRKRRNNLRGLECPCYDESCGEGAAAKLLEDIYATAKVLFDKRATGYKTASYSLDVRSSDLSKEFFLGRARTVLEKRYLHYFPFLERQALDRHVKEEAEFLNLRYHIMLKGRLTDDEVIGFYSASDFDDGKDIDDTDVNPGRRPGSFPDSPTLIRKHQSPSWERVVSALAAKYLHTWPWLGIDACRELSTSNNTWLQEQMHSCGPGLSRHADSKVIAFYGAEEYDILK